MTATHSSRSAGAPPPLLARAAPSARRGARARERRLLAGLGVAAVAWAVLAALPVELGSLLEPTLPVLAPGFAATSPLAWAAGVLVLLGGGLVALAAGRARAPRPHAQSAGPVDEVGEPAPLPPVPLRLEGGARADVVVPCAAGPGPAGTGDWLDELLSSVEPAAGRVSRFASPSIDDDLLPSRRGRR